MTTATQESVAPSLSGIAGRRIRGLRSEAGFSQAELVLRTRLKLSRAAMSERETGIKPVPVDELPAFADALGTSVAYLMGLIDDRSRPLEETASEYLRACRDSNPKPSDLEPASERARRAWGISDFPSVDPLPTSARVIRFPLERRSVA